jgi:4-amino-4-deoxy-L-arabinose transferase-like glycosyltransferase
LIDRLSHDGVTLPRRTIARAGIVLVALTVITRLPALLHPGPIDDEFVYAVIGAEIAAGQLPYVDVVERKPPVLMWSYGAIARAAGAYNWPALHTIALAWTLLTMWGLYVLGRRLFGPPTGILAALLYSVYLPWGVAANLAFNGEMLMNLPLGWAWALVLGRRATSATRWFVAGILLATASLLKQPAAVAVSPLFAYLLIRRPESAAHRGRDGLALGAGIVASLGVVVAILWRGGALWDAYYWSIADHAAPIFFWRKAVLHTVAFAGACLPIVVGAGIALGRGDLWQGRAAERLALAGWLGTSFIGASAGGPFYPHYYIQLVLPLALLSAAAAADLWHKAPDSRLARKRLRTAALCVVLTIVAFSISHWRGLAERRAGTEAGRYLREHAAPNARLFVWGQEGRIYADSQLRPATRYLATFPLTGYVFGGPIAGLDTSQWIRPGAWSTFAREFDGRRPEYVVDTQTRADALYPVGDFPAIADRLRACYEVEAHVKEGIIYRRLQLPRCEPEALKNGSSINQPRDHVNGG